ncbi:MAG: hypothetical protein BWX92_02802 [Deltaproteobacteria bacterium ADurb.Bin135]|nr:MAG: hypothetical protein BWX92_02802 [Deltaproteobacteria bacterium ADurb.Bin135]
MEQENCNTQQNDMVDAEKMERILSPLHLVINLLSRASKQPGPEIVSIREYQTIADYLIYVADVIKREFQSDREEESPTLL